MKKLILLALLSFSAMQYANAEGIVVTAAGRALNNGETYRIGYEQTDMGFYTEYLWEPDLYISSTNGTQHVLLNFSPADKGFSICWPSLCVEVEAGTSRLVEGDATATSASLQIHRSLFAAPEADGSCSVQITDDDGDRFSFTILCLNSPADNTGSVQQISSHATPAAYYSIDGIRLSEPAPGLNIVVYSDGSVSKQYVK